MTAVFDPYSYANKAPIDWLERDYEDTEKALVRWTELCVANPNKCSLAAKANNTAEGVHKLVKNVLETAYRNYDGTVWDALMPGLYDPDYRGLSSYTIDAIMKEQAAINGTSTLQSRSLDFIHHIKRALPYAAASEPNLNPPTELNMLVHAIACGDSIDAPGKTTKQLFEKIVKTSQTASPIFAPGATRAGLRMFCHRWTSRAVERLPKRMNIKPKNVVLVIGNTADPHLYVFSVDHQACLLTNLLSVPRRSTCVDDIIRKYANGKPPKDARNDEADVECNPDDEPFDIPRALDRSTIFLSPHSSGFEDILNHVGYDHTVSPMANAIAVNSPAKGYSRKWYK
ncbi:6522_t:CDS:2 [Acaulospora colombiana]|uniref:6522_t:CDS:1 n=1 Tax=Acaulospora colombiana TaxID=27376 RepID=A0ACA9N5C8_9GLOM|nr:6522_t:CDS:2 [Acaulospora colombiana]